MGRRILNDALRAMVNAERRRKSVVELKPISTVMSSFLKIMKDRGRAQYSSPFLLWILFVTSKRSQCFAALTSYLWTLLAMWFWIRKNVELEIDWNTCSINTFGDFVFIYDNKELFSFHIPIQYFLELALLLYLF